MCNQKKKHFYSYITKGSTVALLLDYDGTLAPLADHPNNTAMEPVSQAVLGRLVHHPNVFVAFISGRGVRDVRAKVALPNATYAGNHGLEIHYANGTQWHYEVPSAVRANYTPLVAQLQAIATGGAWLENKDASLTFHYRDVAGEAAQRALHAAAVERIEALGYVANAAHAAVEAKPPVQWNKGEAALQILRERFGREWAKTTRVLFAGDDVTDEDAMRALQGVGRSFRVSAKEDVQTYADYRLPSTRAVSELLEWVEKAL